MTSPGGNEGEPVGLAAECREEHFHSAKRHLESRGFNPGVLDYLREWGLLNFGPEENISFLRFRRGEKGDYYPFLKIVYFGSFRAPSLLFLYAPEGLSLSSNFELNVHPVERIDIKLEDPQNPKVVFEAPWRKGRIEIAQDGSLFFEGCISPPSEER